jgi:two-component sensor histidine kinase
MSKLKSYLQRLVHYGLHPKSDEGEKKRVILLNVFSWLAVITFTFSYFDSVYFNEPVIYQYLNASMIFGFGIIPLLIRRSSYFAAGYLIFLANAIILFFSNSQGVETATYLFYFPQFFAVAWLLEFKRPWYNGLLASFTLVSVVLLILLPPHLFGPPLAGLTAKFSFVFNLVTSIILVAVNTIVIVWMNYERHKMLENKISEKVKVTEELEQTLKAKEILVAEIHHRVKNNLAVIRSLLNLQMNSTRNEEAKSVLLESVNRVNSMALIHRRLYSQENAEVINFGNYANDLINEIAITYQQDGKVFPEIHLQEDHCMISLTKAVPAGLILNELLSNAFKHAFAADQKGIIDVRITETPSSVCVEVIDNGRGIPAGFDPQQSESLGMTIIHALSDQIDGQFMIGSGEKKGTRAKLVFPNTSK